MSKSNTVTAAMIPAVEANAFADAYGEALASYKVAFAAAAPTLDAASGERDTLRTIVRGLRWAAFDYVQSQPEGMRETEANAVAEQIATVDPAVKDASVRKMQQRMRFACVDYPSALANAKRDKADPFSLAQAAHKAARAAADRKAVRDQYGERAAELAAADLNTTATKLGLMVGDGDVTASELYEAYLTELSNGADYVSRVANGWAAASDANRAEVIRFIDSVRPPVAAD